jgi:hypothetical protein
MSSPFNFFLLGCKGTENQGEIDKKKGEIDD